MALTQVSRGLLSTSIVDNGNATAITIDSSENVGIGTSSPSQELHIKTTGSQVEVVLESSGQTSSIFNNSNAAFGVIDGSTERLRIDASGNVLVGKTAATISTTGVELRPNGQVFATQSGNYPLLLNRTTSDGDIAQFRKDGTAVGSIGVESSNNMYFESSASSHTGLTFPDNAIVPRKDGSNSDASVDLGASGVRFKDLYLSGGAYLGGTGSANKLDDYEEGTWTPAGYSGWATNPTAVSGNYTKIGRFVMLNVLISGGSFNDQCYLTGIPFNEAFEGTSPVVNGSIDNVATAMVASTNRIWFSATNGTNSDGARLSIVYEAS